MSKKKTNREAEEVTVEDLLEEGEPATDEEEDIRIGATPAELEAAVARRNEEIAAATKEAEAILEEEDAKATLGKTYAASSSDVVATLWKIYGKDKVKALPGFRKMTIEQITAALS